MTDRVAYGDRSGWAARGEQGSEFSIRFLFGVYRFLGRRICLALLHPIAIYFTLFSPEVRRSSYQYFERLCADTPGKIPNPWLWTCYRHVFEFARCLLDKIAAWENSFCPSRMEWDGREEFLATVGSGSGVVLLGAHIGNNEVLRALGTMLPVLKVNALMYTSHTSRFQRLLTDTNPDSNLRVISLEFINPKTIIELQDCVDKGEVVAMLADRVSAKAPDKFITLPFLGRPARFPVGPLLVADLLHCSVFMVFCVHTQGDEYRIVFRKLAQEIKLSRKDRQADIAAYVQSYVAELEKICREHPFQWFNFYNYWRDE